MRLKSSLLIASLSFLAGIVFLSWYQKGETLGATSTSRNSDQVSCEDFLSYKAFIKNHLSEGKADFEDFTFTLNALEKTETEGGSSTVYVVRCAQNSDMNTQQHAVLVEENGELREDIFFHDWFGHLLETDYGWGDYRKQISFIMGTGGNCGACEYSEILMIGKGGVDWVTRDVNNQEDRSAREIKLSNSRDIPILTVMDSSWAFAFGVCHACSPYRELIYDWNSQERRFVPVTTQHEAYYQEKLESAPFDEQQLCQDNTIDGCLGAAISRLLVYESAGMREEGWRWYQEEMSQLKSLHNDDYNLGLINDSLNTLGYQFDNNLPFAPKMQRDR